nr:DUF58 domain-containing protein [Pseudoruegeria sp. HB172150]
MPPLLAEAEHLAQAVLLGFHGRRRAGMGDEFWQYRPARDGDEARLIDWRRSGRSDMHFVQEKEWQAAQSVFIWLDESQSMGFSGDKNRSTKLEHGRLLSLALSILLIRGGERVALASLGTPPRSSELQLLRIAQSFAMERESPDYGAPEVRNLLPHSRALFVSDFMGDLAPLEAQLAKAADRGVRGVLYQLLDPQEEAFPFDGRTIFESMGKTLRHETLKAGDLRDRYLQRLAERKARLDDLAHATGWQYECHHTGDSAQAALLWLYGALERKG